MQIKNECVIEKCIEVLGATKDGNRLTEKQLSEVEFLSNNYYRLSAQSAQKALRSLSQMTQYEKL